MVFLELKIRVTDTLDKLNDKVFFKQQGKQEPCKRPIQVSLMVVMRLETFTAGIEGIEDVKYCKNDGWDGYDKKEQ